MSALQTPYFIWDYDLTDADVRVILRGDDEEQKAWLVARLGSLLCTCGLPSRTMNASFALQDRFLERFFAGSLPWEDVKAYFLALARELLARIKPS